jgi:hypothetical protein
MKRLILSATNIYKVKDLPSDIWVKEADDSEVYKVLKVTFNRDATKGAEYVVHTDKGDLSRYGADEFIRVDEPEITEEIIEVPKFSKKSVKKGNLETIPADLLPMNCWLVQGYVRYGKPNYCTSSGFAALESSNILVFLDERAAQSKCYYAHAQKVVPFQITEDHKLHRL